jgi:hypothetical protein
MPPNYLWRYRPLPEPTDALTVVLAPGSTFVDTGNPLVGDVLFLAERITSYYTQRAPFAVKAVLEQAKAAGLRRIIFTGQSKGGFGAILLAGLCAQRMPARSFHCLAYNPQTRLWPENGNLLGIPSYDAICRKAATRAGFRAYLERYGDLKFVERLPNLHVTLVYPEAFAQDVAEAAHLCAPNIRKMPVAYPAHAVRTVSDMRNSEPEEIRERIRTLQRVARRDPDMARMLDGSIDGIVAHVGANRWLPGLDDLLAQTLAVELRPV